MSTFTRITARTKARNREKDVVEEGEEEEAQVGARERR